MATKICSKCKEKKNVSCFYKHKGKKDGLGSQCKSCIKIYNKDNALRISEQRKQHRKNNPEKMAKQGKQYYKNNKESLLKKQKQRNKRDTVKIAKQRKQYRKNNAKQKTQYNNSDAIYERHFKQLEQFEKIRKCSKNPKLLEVKCAYCGKWLIPTNLRVRNRIGVFNGTQCGEQRFYCSEYCKQACPIFNQKFWPKGFKKATLREVIPLLRQLVLKRDDYTCQKCGATTETAQLHVHHEKSYTLNKMMANDPDNCITLCKDCHKWIHSQKGCRNIDLRCSTNQNKT